MELYPRPIPTTLGHQQRHTASPSTGGLLSLSPASMNLPSTDINPSSGSIITPPPGGSTIDPISSVIIHTGTGGCLPADQQSFIPPASMSNAQAYPIYTKSGRPTSCTERGACE
ncbi:hypothetical protein SK128_010970, partial [Halocaridina rubra]